MKRGRKPRDERELIREVNEACKAVVARGKRPTLRNVREWFIARYGVGGSFTDIVPHVRAWKTARRDSKAVEAVCRAYSELDPEQKKAVRDILGLIPKP